MNAKSHSFGARLEGVRLLIDARAASMHHALQNEVVIEPLATCWQRQPVSNQGAMTPSAGGALNRTDLFSTRAFFALSRGVSHFLAFAKGFVADAFDLGVVEEKILAGFSHDETEAFVGQSGDGAFRHGEFSSK